MTKILHEKIKIMYDAKNYQSLSAMATQIEIKLEVNVFSIRSINLQQGEREKDEINSSSLSTSHKKLTPTQSANIRTSAVTEPFLMELLHEIRSCCRLLGFHSGSG